MADTTAYLLDAVEAGKKILFEGAQGALLDIDHGTFPFVTSSNSSGVGVSSGSGVPGRYITKVLGIIKAYSTRVGGGPFPTEQDNAIGQHIRDRGNEYGTVTRRPRRCGWFDAVAARYTARLERRRRPGGHAAGRAQRVAGVEDLHGLRARRRSGSRIFPATWTTCGGVVPVYETLPGWQQEISHVRRMADLPPAGPRLSRSAQRSWWAGRWKSFPWGPTAQQTIFAEPCRPCLTHRPCPARLP